MQLHIGIDDTDSRKGGCTTYIAARLVEKLGKMGVTFIDYPNIIRLNPNIPYKTRGNAAVALRIKLERAAYDSVVETVLQQVEENSYFGRKGTEPAITFVAGKPRTAIKEFSRRTLHDVIPDGAAVRLIRRYGGKAAAYGGTLGLVGALAAVGQTLDGDHTYELVAYRTRRYWGTPRRVDEESVKRMDKLTAPNTFNNYDFEHRRMLVTPHGPDPVLLGIRGESAKAVLGAFRMLRIDEPIERWVIYRTNHGTDAHLRGLTKLERVEPNTPIALRGVVADHPKTIRGGHTFFTLNFGGKRIKCAAFEPTDKLRNAAARLLPGDTITAYGGVHTRGDEGSAATINLEKMLIHAVAEQFRHENPLCPNCGKHMKSAGREQGFRCARCSILIPRAHRKIVKIPRTLKPGLYAPALKAHRHLTKPLSRYGLEKSWNGKCPSGRWHEP